MKTRRASPKSDIKPGTASASRRTPPVVMDVLPWPGGYGFAGRDNWWRHVFSQSERERLDNLIGLALLDNQVCEQLVTKRDPALLSVFGLSKQTQDWLKGLQASTLKELAQLIVAATKPRHSDVAPAGAA
jgi:hypothetical protein